MKFDIEIEDWGKTILNTTAKNLTEAVQIIFDNTEKHPGAFVNVCIGGDYCVLMDMARSPDVEANLLKLENQVLKAKQKLSAARTNEILHTKNPNHYREAAKKRWGNHLK